MDERTGPHALPSAPQGPEDRAGGGVPAQNASLAMAAGHTARKLTEIASASASDTIVAEGDGVTWTAPEFIKRTKTAPWYVVYFGTSFFLAALVYLLTKDYVSTGVIVFAALSLAAVTMRQPRVLRYHLSDAGLTIANKFYSYQLFKSFSVIYDEGVSNVYLFPLRRLAPSLTVQYDPSDEHTIVELLTVHLPFEQRKLDMLEQFMRQIHL